MALPTTVVCVCVCVCVCVLECVCVSNGTGYGLTFGVHTRIDETIDRFKHYYQSLDVLLIDDIQFLSDKQRSQEEFFHVFETMTINQRQIVITCDTYPKELKGIPRRVDHLSSGARDQPG